MLDPKRPDSTSTPFYFPMAVAGVAVVYNVPGANEYLNLTQDVLAGIFLGQISYWNDPRIVALNPRSSLPPTEIVLVHRSDASATTFTLSDYLAKVSPAWRQHAGSGASVNWPTRGLAGVGNDGVAKLIHDTAYSIGYVDVTYATTNRLAMAAIKNRAGYFVFAQAGNLTAAAGTIDGGLPDDFRTSITDSPAAEAYPIASFTYILTPRRFSDPGKRAAISDLLTWAITTGQKDNVNQGFAPLPQDMIKRERRQIGLIK
jgi:phosphate transport system substrate-binding protein